MSWPFRYTKPPSRECLDFLSFFPLRSHVGGKVLVRTHPHSTRLSCPDIRRRPGVSDEPRSVSSIMSVTDLQRYEGRTFSLPLPLLLRRSGCLFPCTRGRTTLRRSGVDRVPGSLRSSRVPGRTYGDGNETTGFLSVYEGS